MAVVTGTLSDFSLSSLSSHNPRIIFTGSDVGFLGKRLLATKPVILEPASSGAFTVDLQPTDTTAVEVWYTIRIEWLDSDGGYVGVDFVDWRLYVPSEGGSIGDLLRAPANPARVWVGLEPPENPSPGTWWLEANYANPTDPRNTGNLYEWL